MENNISIDFDLLYGLVKDHNQTSFYKSLMIETKEDFLRYIY